MVTAHEVVEVVCSWGSLGGRWRFLCDSSPRSWYAIRSMLELPTRYVLIIVPFAAVCKAEIIIFLAVNIVQSDFVIIKMGSKSDYGCVG